MTDIEYLKKYYKGDLEEAITRLEQGEPVQYIVGNVEFFGYRMEVNSDVLIPRFETELLVEKVISYIHEYFKESINIVDIGTGSGCIAITISKELGKCVDAVDISKQALEVAKRNASYHKADVHFIEGNMLEALNKKYDVIISNPPYIAYDEEVMDIVKNNEPHIALYAEHNGLYFYEQILKEAKNKLKDRGLIAFEIGSSQTQAIKELSLQYLKDSEVIVEQDLQGLDRFIFIKYHI